jgi:hypothetical protein
MVHREAAMFNRSEIMKATWSACRRSYTFNGRFHFRRENFAKALRQAWVDARRADGSLSPAIAAKLDRADAIREQIDSLKYKSFQVNVEPTRQRLERELAALA